MKAIRCLMLVASMMFASSVRAQVVFSGDADRDFPGTQNVVRIEDSLGVPDVGVPSQLGNVISGWDIQYIYFQYNAEADELNVGVDCFGVYGDADGNGNPDESSPGLLSIGGTDTEDMSTSESFAMALDFNLDVPLEAGFGQQQPFDFIVGVPGGNPIGGALSDSDPGCQNFGISDCFGIYSYVDIGAVAPAFRFASRFDHPVINHNPDPSEQRPDIEFTIPNLEQLRSTTGANFEVSRFEPWQLRTLTFMGSFVDSGVGEEYVPSQDEVSVVEFPCSQFDECDVCVGDSSTCVDCLGVPNGNADYDDCGVCGGDGSSCADCLGIPNGPNTYDACGVCAGDGSSCADCNGIPNGGAVYDACDVCDGDGQSCLDCAGTPNGPSVYDVCDVCNGNGDSCLDCAGIPNGPSVYDVCGVCGGRGDSCLDCRGTPNGNAEYDACGICAGDSSTCLDCRGVPNGPAFYDVCDVCDGDGNTCLDCAGVPNGPNTYDVCDVCNGDSTTCHDCAGTPNGPAVYDVCDICDGDGTSCQDCLGVPNGVAEYDVCDVCAGAGNTCLDCAGIPNGATTVDICGVCGGDGTSCLDCNGTPFGDDMPDICGVCGGDNTSCVCLEIHHCPIEEVDHFLLEWSLVALSDKIYHTQDLLQGIKEELCRYDAFEGALALEVSDYLQDALDFREILDNFCYVNLWFHGALEGDAALLSLAPRREHTV